MNKATFKLFKAAAKKGGDRYTGEIGGEEVTVYLPQSITRDGGTPAPTIIISVEVP